MMQVILPVPNQASTRNLHLSPAMTCNGFPADTQSEPSCFALSSSRSPIMFYFLNADPVLLFRLQELHTEWEQHLPPLSGVSIFHLVVVIRFIVWPKGNGHHCRLIRPEPEELCPGFRRYPGWHGITSWWSSLDSRKIFLLPGARIMKSERTTEVVRP